jgi:hypothetical protein
VSNNAGKTVAEIRKGKKASIQNAPLPKAAPSWDDILNLPWEEIVTRAKPRVPGFQTLRKLHSDPEYDK